MKNYFKTPLDRKRFMTGFTPREEEIRAMKGYTRPLLTRATNFLVAAKQRQSAHIPLTQEQFQGLHRAWERLVSELGAMAETSYTNPDVQRIARKDDKRADIIAVSIRVKVKSYLDAVRDFEPVEPELPSLEEILSGSYKAAKKAKKPEASEAPEASDVIDDDDDFGGMEL